jgi:hypothetical protein
MKFLSGASYLAQERPATSWVLQDLVPRGGIFTIYGKPKTGKSYFLLGLCEAIATGKPHFLGLPIQTHGPCLYLQIDTPRWVWMDRVEKLQRTGHYDFSTVHFADKSMVPYPFDIMECGNQFAPIIQEVKPVLIVIDTFREAHMGDENDSGAMKVVVNQLVKCCGDSALALAAHRKKEGMQSDDLMDDLRGTSYLPGRMDCLMALGAKTLRYQSREMELCTLNCSQNDDLGGVQALDADAELQLKLIHETFLESVGMSKRAQGELLAQKYNATNPAKKMTADAGRKHIERRAHLFQPRKAS